MLWPILAAVKSRNEISPQGNADVSCQTAAGKFSVFRNRDLRILDCSVAISVHLRAGLNLAHVQYVYIQYTLCARLVHSNLVMSALVRHEVQNLGFRSSLSSFWHDRMLGMQIWTSAY